MKNDAALWQRGMEWGKELLAPPPRSHAEAYRHELKYLISYADKAELAVADGVAHPEKFAVALPNNFDVEVEFVKHNRARRASFYPGVKQLGPRTVRFSSDAYYDVLRFFMFCL